MSNLKRIILHWTAGTYNVNSTDKEHYHFIVDGVGRIHLGKFKPEDNIDCKDGKYAAHALGANTGSIGIAIACMYNPAKYPPTKKQCEVMFKLCADLCKKYNISIEEIYDHRTIDKIVNGETNRKIDFIALKPYHNANKENMAEFIRQKVLWYYKNS